MNENEQQQTDQRDDVVDPGTTTDGEAPQDDSDHGQKSGLDALNEALGEPSDAPAAGAGDGEDADGDAGGEGETDQAAKGDGASAAKEAKGEARAGEADRGGDKDQARKGDQSPQEPDPINDPLPDWLKGKTRTRMEQLVKIAKEADTRVKEAIAQRDEIVDTIRGTGASPEQFARMLDTLTLLNSRNIEDRKKGLAMLREDIQSISALLGEDTGDPGLLDRHPDLKEAVEQGDMDVRYARELALARDQRARAQQREQEQQRLTEQQQREIEQGRAALNALEEELRGDPDYQRKKAILIPQLKPVLAKIPPSQWAHKFAAEYAKLKLDPVDSGKDNGAGQPLRGRQPSGLPRRQPRTGLEAVNMALDELAGRDPT